MAKGKRAVALFEVIHKDKRFDRKSPASEKPPEVAPPLVQRQSAKQAVDLWRKNHSDPETWTAPGPTLRESAASFFEKIKSMYSTIQSRRSALANTTRLWISRTNGVAPGVGAALIVIFVMLAARHWFHPASPALTIEDALRSGPPHPDVLVITPPVTATNTIPAAPPTISPEIALDEQQASQKIVSTLAEPGKRVVNMHYVLMQSYFEEKTAEQARDFLTQYGIPCTIERGIKGWRSDYYQVIGLQGFARASGPQYVAYREKIEKLGLEFSPKSHYKRFVPQAIKW